VKIKKEYFILGIIILALVAYIAFEQKGQINYVLPEFEDCKKDDISKMVIEQGKSIIHVVREDNKWFIKPYNYKADVLKIEEMIKSCSTLRLTSMVSESKNYSLYDLDSENRIRVTVFRGSEVIRQFDIGKTPSSYRHTFIKLPDDDRVFHATNDIRQHFNNVVSEARDKAVLKFDTNEIKKVRLFDGAKSMTLVVSFLPVADKTDEKKKAMAGTVWKTENGEDVKTATMVNLIQTLSNLTCENYAGDEIKSDSGKIQCGLLGKQISVFPVGIHCKKNYGLFCRFEKKVTLYAL